MFQYDFPPYSISNDVCWLGKKKCTVTNRPESDRSGRCRRPLDESAALAHFCVTMKRYVWQECGLRHNDSFHSPQANRGRLWGHSDESSRTAGSAGQHVGRVPRVRAHHHFQQPGGVQRGSRFPSSWNEEKRTARFYQWGPGQSVSRRSGCCRVVAGFQMFCRWLLVRGPELWTGLMLNCR